MANPSPNLPPSVPVSYTHLGRRQIYFHFGGSAADHGNDGHSGSDGFGSFEQAFLDIPVERSIEPGVSQLSFMVFVLGGDLLEPVYGFVIGVGGCLLYTSGLEWCLHETVRVNNKPSKIVVFISLCIMVLVCCQHKNRIKK